MKTIMVRSSKGSLIVLLMIIPFLLNARDGKTIIKKYLNESHSSSRAGTKLQRYRMSAVYLNRDLYGNFIDKTRISGDYTKGLGNGFVQWNNVSLSEAKNFREPFTTVSKLHYMENFKYVPSPAMLSTGAFREFPSDPASVFAKNLIWDMMGIEEFAFSHTDSLKLNKVYRIPANGEFNMAGIGTYDHAEIQLCRTGISVVNDEVCVMIDYRAPDNRIALTMPGVTTKGTEQYWGTVWVSLKTGELEYAVMFGGAIQEIALAGVKDKILVKTIRELKVEKLK